MVDLWLIIFLLLRMQGKNSIDQKRLMPIANCQLRDLTTLLYFSFRPTGSCERQKDEESSFVTSATQVDSRNRNLTEKGFKILTLYT